MWLDRQRSVSAHKHPIHSEEKASLQSVTIFHPQPVSITGFSAMQGVPEAEQSLETEALRPPSRVHGFFLAPSLVALINEKYAECKHMTDELWPALPYDAWKDTYETLHMWTQVVGKVALAQEPPLNHSWAVALQVTPRGLSTRTLPHGRRSFTWRRGMSSSRAPTWPRRRNLAGSTST